VKLLIVHLIVIR